MSITPTKKFRFFIIRLLLVVFAFVAQHANCGCASSKMGAEELSTAVKGNKNTVTNIYYIHNHYRLNASPRAQKAAKSHILRMQAGRRRSSSSGSNSSMVVPLAAGDWSRQSRLSKPRTPLTSSNCDSSEFDDVDTFDLP